MNDFFSDLYDYITEHTPEIRGDPEYEQALQAYRKLEEEVKEKTGDTLLYQYQCAQADISRRWERAVFIQSLRFGRRFLLEVLG